MANTEGYVPIQLRPRLVLVLAKRFEEAKLKKFPDVPVKFGSYVNNVIDDVVKRLEKAEELAPDLELDDYSYNRITIRDRRTKKRFDIYRHDMKIRCEKDESFDCEHVLYALEQPEIAKLGLRRSKR